MPNPADCEEARAAVRGGKGGKRKGSLQQGFQPACVVNRATWRIAGNYHCWRTGEQDYGYSQVISDDEVALWPPSTKVIDRETAQLVAEEMATKLSRVVKTNWKKRWMKASGYRRCGL